jgi:nitrate reductase gamma subunit
MKKKISNIEFHGFGFDISKTRCFFWLMNIVLFDEEMEVNQNRSLFKFHISPYMIILHFFFFNVIEKQRKDFFS